MWFLCYAGFYEGAIAFDGFLFDSALRIILQSCSGLLNVSSSLLKDGVGGSCFVSLTGVVGYSWPLILNFFVLGGGFSRQRHSSLV